MKAIKRCYARYLWRHKFDIISEKTQLNWRGTGSHIGERRCTRCGLHQKISNTLGFLFLDEETGGK